MTQDATSVNARLARLDPAQRAALAARLSATRSGPPPLRPLPGPRRRFPLGMDQERLWILDRMFPGTTTYTLGFGLRFLGDFDLTAFTRAVDAVVDRHELLRCGIDVDNGVPYLRPHPDRRADIDYVELAGPAEDAEARRAAYIDRQVRRTFDLAADPVLRIGVAYLGNGDYQVVETMPHSFTDQWSYVRLNRELIEHYRAFKQGDEPRVPVLPVQFGDYAQWQRDYFSSERSDHHRTFWRDYLAGAPRLMLPHDHSPDTTDHTGRQYSFVLDNDVAAAFIAAAGQARTTVATATLAAYVALLHEETGQRDIVVGVPSVTRSQSAVADIIGFLLTNVPVRVRLPEHPTPRQILAAVIVASTASAEHREVPYGEIVKAALPDRSATRYPLLQTMLVHLNLEESVFFAVPGAQVYANAVPEGISSMDMTVAWWQVSDTMYGRIEYRTALFEAATIERLSRRLVQLMDVFASAPDTALQPATPAADISVLRSAEPATASAAARRGQLAAAWCAVLGADSAAPEATFLTAGGTPLLGVRLAQVLTAAGWTVSAREVLADTTFGQLADALLTTSDQAAGNPPAGRLSADQEMLLDDNTRPQARSVTVEWPEPVDPARLQAALEAVITAHPALGMTVRSDGAGRTARVTPAWHWHIAVPGSSTDDIGDAHRAVLDIEHGPVFAAGLIPGGPAQLVLTASCLVVDARSWDIILRDLALAYDAQALVPEPVGFLAYAACLRGLDPAPQAAYWRAQLDDTHPDGDTRPGGASRTLTVPVGSARRPTPEEILACVARAVRTGDAATTVSVVLAGREPPGALPAWEPDLAVGRYATRFPLRLPLAPGATCREDLHTVRAVLRGLPDGGKGFGLLRHCADPALREEFARRGLPRITVDLAAAPDAYTARTPRNGPTVGGANTLGDGTPMPPGVDIEVTLDGRAGEEILTWRFDPAACPPPAIARIAENAAADLAELLSEPVDAAAPAVMGVSEEYMDRLFARVSQVHQERQ